MTSVRVPSVGRRLPRGLASAYSESYPAGLLGVLSELEWRDVITRFNHTLLSYWPCDLCFFGGILCIPCTFGLSFWAPTQCLTEVEEQADHFLEQVSSRPCFYDRKISFSLEHGWCGSNMVITFPADVKKASAVVERDLESGESPLPPELKKTH